MDSIEADYLRVDVIDYEDALDRFDGNMALYERLALKFSDDRHVEALCRALDAGDADAAYREAHSLKGVAGNLSFVKLYRNAAAMSDALHAGDLARARALAPQLVQAHDDILAVLCSSR